MPKALHAHAASTIALPIPTHAFTGSLHTCVALPVPPYALLASEPIYMLCLSQTYVYENMPPCILLSPFSIRHGSMQTYMGEGAVMTSLTGTEHFLLLLPCSDYRKEGRKETISSVRRRRRRKKSKCVYNVMFCELILAMHYPYPCLPPQQACPTTKKQQHFTHTCCHGTHSTLRRQTNSKINKYSD